MHGIELSLLIQKILDFVEARMVIVASNLSAVVGTAFSAKLMITPGSHTELANMNSCDVQLLGSKKMFLAGFSRLLTDIVGLSSKQMYFRPHPHLCKLVLVATWLQNQHLLHERILSREIHRGTLEYVYEWRF
jgi:hypothetical protein